VGTQDNLSGGGDQLMPGPVRLPPLMVLNLILGGDLTVILGLLIGGLSYAMLVVGLAVVLGHRKA
jgi:hypothetical protein